MERILVTGATGKIGRELIARLLEQRREVKAGTRDPRRAAGMFPGSVEIVELDYERTETWDEAVMWADRIFLMPAPFEPRADEALIPFLDWAVSSGTDHVVLLSAMGVEALPHVPLHRVEQRVRETGVPYTFLRPNWYMQNFLAGFLADPIRARGAFALPAGDGAVSFVDARDVAAVAAHALCADAAGAEWTLTGPRALTHAGAAAILSAAAGRPIGYEAITDDVMRAQLERDGWADGEAEMLIGLLREIRRGGRAAVTDTVRAVLDREPTSLEAFAAENAAAWARDAPAPD
jgi:uncharacterized protein YbjT (DUF2867 family)